MDYNAILKRYSRSLYLDYKLCIDTLRHCLFDIALAFKIEKMISLFVLHNLFLCFFQIFCFEFNKNIFENTTMSSSFLGRNFQSGDRHYASFYARNRCLVLRVTQDYKTLRTAYYIPHFRLIYLKI